MASAKSVVRVLDHGHRGRDWRTPSDPLDPGRVRGSRIRRVRLSAAVGRRHRPGGTDVGARGLRPISSRRRRRSRTQVFRSGLAQQPPRRVPTSSGTWRRTSTGTTSCSTPLSSTASRWSTALEAGGLSVHRWDVSHRPADDGHFYDWFARLRLKPTNEECRARSPLSSPRQRSVPPRPYPQRRASDGHVWQMPGGRSRRLSCSGSHGDAEREVTVLRRSLAESRDPRRLPKAEQRYRDWTFGASALRLRDHLRDVAWGCSRHTDLLVNRPRRRSSGARPCRELARFWMPVRDDRNTNARIRRPGGAGRPLLARLQEVGA